MAEIRFMRMGAFVLLAFVIAYALRPGLRPAGSSGWALTLHLVSIIDVLALILVSYTAWMERYWRQIELTVCSICFATMLGLALLNQEIEPLYVMIMGILLADGLVLPWNSIWQVALTSAGLAAFVVFEVMAPEAVRATNVQWFSLIASMGLGQMFSALMAHHRRELRDQMVALRESQARLQAEIAERERALRQRERAERELRASRDSLRRIIDAAPDPIAVNRLSDGSFIDFNRRFRDLGYRPDELQWLRNQSAEAFADPKQLESFMAELAANGSVSNMEVMFRNPAGEVQPHLISAVQAEIDGEQCLVSIVRNISGMRAAQELLKASQETTRAIFDNLADMVVVCRLADNTFLDVNGGFENVTGLTRTDVIGKQIDDFGLWAEPEQRELFVRELRAGRTVRNMETEFLRDGRTVTGLVSGAPLELGGEPCGIAIIRDVTELRETSKMLARRERTLRQIFDATVDIITINDFTTGTYLEANEELVRRSGIPREQILQKRPPELGMWPDLAELANYVNLLRASGEVRNLEVRQYYNGQVVPCLISGVVFEMDGRPYALSILRDIKDIRETQRRLSESEASLRKIFDTGLDIITVTENSSGRYVEVNEEFCRRTGLTREEVIGTPFGQLKIWVDPRQRDAFVYELLASNESRNFEADFYVKDGSIAHYLLSATVIELNGRSCSLTFARDITTIKDTERDLIAAREAALAASRAKSEFLSSMSHEIRTPMNALLGMADLLAETPVSPEQRRYVETLVNNGNALLELINSILDLAKIESGRLSLERAPFDLYDLVEKAAETLAMRAHEKNLEIIVRIAPTVRADLIGDSLRLRQILINLIGNAIKFTEAGEVQVSVEPDGTSDNPGCLRFSVADTGIGIAPDNLPTLFSAFTQADSSTTRKYGGSGLGLAIVERLVGMMGGRVSAESKLGEGSIFSFTARFDPQTKSEPPRALPDLNGTSVLVVDDSANCRHSLSEVLARCGAAVTEAVSGNDALETCAASMREGRRFDALVVDARMPALSGFETAERMIAIDVPRQTIMMMLCADNLNQDISKLKSIGIDAWLLKPVGQSNLLVSVGAAVESMRPRTPASTIDNRAATARDNGAILDRPLRILLADDSPDNRLLVQTYLRNTPYSVDEAENGNIAVEKFVANRYDLVLMDIQMPEVDGYSATRAIRRWEQKHNLPRTAILALTASALEENVRATREAGCDLHVTKPVKKNTLLQAIRDAILNAPQTGTSGSADEA
ncbi:MAG: PAS domain S-box protein [Candidatus Binataceae bacterium]